MRELTIPRLNFIFTFYFSTFLSLFYMFPIVSIYLLLIVFIILYFFIVIIIFAGSYYHFFFFFVNIIFRITFVVFYLSHITTYVTFVMQSHKITFAMIFPVIETTLLKEKKKKRKKQQQQQQQCHKIQGDYFTSPARLLSLGVWCTSSSFNHESS